jgi:hypothetical protein
MSSKHERTLREVFSEPAKANIEWASIERMLKHYGAFLEERAGSRIGVELNGVRAVFHRPHPEKEASRPLVRAVRDFCREAGLEPEEL